MRKNIEYRINIENITVEEREQVVASLKNISMEVSLHSVSPIEVIIKIPGALFNSYIECLRLINVIGIVYYTVDVTVPDEIDAADNVDPERSTVMYGVNATDGYWIRIEGGVHGKHKVDEAGNYFKCSDGTEGFVKFNPDGCCLFHIDLEGGKFNYNNKSMHGDAYSQVLSFLPGIKWVEIKEGDTWAKVEDRNNEN